MIQSEFVARITGQNPHLYAKEVAAVVNALLGRIVGALADGGRVELRGLGTFEIRVQSARSARDPRTEEKVAVEARTKVRFKTSKTMRARLNPVEEDRTIERERLLQAS